VRKPKGFRVRFQTRTDDGWVTDTLPDSHDNPLDSDLVAWRSAWKLWQANRSETGAYVNITVVDEQDKPVRSYVTGNYDVYNPRPDVDDAVAGKARAES
jgi:hypothetical protein